MPSGSPFHLLREPPRSVALACALGLQISGCTKKEGPKATAPEKVEAVAAVVVPEEAAKGDEQAPPAKTKVDCAKVMSSETLAKLLPGYRLLPSGEGPGEACVFSKSKLDMPDLTLVWSCTRGWSEADMVAFKATYTGMNGKELPGVGRIAYEIDVAGEKMIQAVDADTACVVAAGFGVEGPPANATEIVTAFLEGTSKETAK